MSKRKTCDICKRPEKACYCHTIKKYRNNFPVLIIRHFNEESHPFNTARMAEMTYDNLEIISSNHPELDQRIESFIKDHNPFLLFKSHYSRKFNCEEEEFLYKAMIVIDGTWDQAKGILYSKESLQNLHQLHLDHDVESIYKPIRKACSKSFLSTLEAITMTLENIEKVNLQDSLSPLKYVVAWQKKWSP